MECSTFRRVPLSWLGLFVAACGSGDSTGGGGNDNDPAAIVIVTGDAQSAEAGQPLTLPLVARVNRSNGAPTTCDP